MLLMSYPIVSMEQLTRQLWLARFRAPELAAAARPGQFVMIGGGEGWDPLLRRPFSICQAYSPSSNRGPAGLDPGEVSILFSPGKKVTVWLAQRKPGDKLDVLGPLGNGFTVSPKSRRILLIAGGWGIAPMIGMAAEAVAKGLSVTFLAEFADSSQVLPGSLLPSEARYLVTTQDVSQGANRSVIDLARQLLDGADEVFVSGPTEMLEMVHKLGRSADKATQSSSQNPEGTPKGLTIRRIGDPFGMYGLFEEPMGCGTGICLSCVIETRRGLLRCCADGPVFPLEEVFGPSETQSSPFGIAELR